MNECKHNLLLGCEKETQNHSCRKCYEPFELKNGVCDIQNCKTLNDWGCVHCECGFYLGSDGKCAQVSDGCLRYNRGHCVDCLEHYTLKGGECKIEGCSEYEGNSCKECSERYEKVGNGCQFKNCYDWLDDQCLICNNGFNLKDGVCVESSPDNLVCESV